MLGLDGARGTRYSHLVAAEFVCHVRAVQKKRKGQCVPLQPNALLVDLRADLVNELLHLIVGEVDPFFLKQFLDAAAQVRTFLGGKKQCYAAANYGAAKECV